MLRDLRHPEGGFFSAEDADSEGIEGKFYLWSLDEIHEVCGDDAEEVIEYYGVTSAGTSSTRTPSTRGNILHVIDRRREPSEAVQRGRARLLTRRSRRIRPGLDDKVLLAWNALFLGALTEAAAALDRDDWKAVARANGRFLLTRLRRDDGRLLRSWRAPYLAYAEDYAALLEALCTLAELDNASWLDVARAGRRRAAPPVPRRRAGRILHDRPRRRATRRAAEGRVRQRDAVGELARGQRPPAPRRADRRHEVRRARGARPQHARPRRERAPDRVRARARLRSSATWPSRSRSRSSARAPIHAPPRSRAR